MTAETLTKQPSESRVFRMSFAANMVEGETITSIVSYVTDPATGIVLDTPTISGQDILCRFSEGTGSTLYKVTGVVDTSLGNRLEGDGYLHVKDI